MYSRSNQKRTYACVQFNFDPVTAKQSEIHPEDESGAGIPCTRQTTQTKVKRTKAGFKFLWNMRDEVSNRGHKVRFPGFLYHPRRVILCASV